VAWRHGEFRSESGDLARPYRGTGVTPKGLHGLRKGHTDPLAHFLCSGDKQKPWTEELNHVADPSGGQ